MPVTHLHVEASSHCNASCPGCPRNAYGYPLEGFFEEKHLDNEKLSNLLQKFTAVKSINFCGNHGDPMMNPKILDLCDRDDIDYSIATNGGIGRIETYEQLAKKSNVHIIFGIDGLENTNHLYRQGVVWKRLMLRVDAYIKAGGNAHWKFILFQHNMDQVQEAKKLSEHLGFKVFYTQDHGRNNMPAIQKDKTISHWILPPNKEAVPSEFDVEQYLQSRYSPIDVSVRNFEVDKISCEHLDGSVYVNSLGELFPCCYHGFGHVDRPKVYLEDFDKLKATWSTKSCNSICAETCGR